MARICCRPLAIQFTNDPQELTICIQYDVRKPKSIYNHLQQSRRKSPGINATHPISAHILVAVLFPLRPDNFEKHRRSQASNQLILRSKHIRRDLIFTLRHTSASLHKVGVAVFTGGICEGNSTTFCSLT